MWVEPLRSQQADCEAREFWPSMNARLILLTIHIAAVAAWLGADVLQYAVVPRLERESPEAERAWARQAVWLHAKYYASVAVVVLITGIWLVLDGDWSWSSGFIWVGVGAIVGGATLGGGLLGSLSKRRLAALESGDAAVAAETKQRSFVISLVLTALPLIAILAMVDKWQAEF
jgi:hypothetical protein